MDSPSVSLLHLPAEIHSHILKNLDWPDLNNIFRAWANPKYTYGACNLADYNIDDLILVYIWNESTLKAFPFVGKGVDYRDRRQHVLRVLRMKVLHLLRYIESDNKPAELNFVTAQLYKLRRRIPNLGALAAENVDKLVDAVKDIVETVRDVILFCDTVYPLDAAGAVVRIPLDPLTKTTYMIYLLYCMAMDYIQAEKQNIYDSAPMSEGDAVILAWNYYRSYLETAFDVNGPGAMDALDLIDRSVWGSCAIVQKYVELLEGCYPREDRFPAIYKVFVQDFELTIDLPTIATFCLSFGPSTALKFLNQDKSTISFVKKHMDPRSGGRRLIRAWEGFRAYCKPEEDTQYENEHTSQAGMGYSYGYDQSYYLDTITRSLDATPIHGYEYGGSVENATEMDADGESHFSSEYYGYNR